jgi:hypothetical protein
VRSVHLQASTARGYDKTSDRLYGGVSYVHPSLVPNEDAELEFTLWTRSLQRPAGVLINQQAIEQGVHQLRHGEAEVAQRFLDLQQFTGLSWMHEVVGSAHLQGDLHPFASEDTALVYTLCNTIETYLARAISFLAYFVMPNASIWPLKFPHSSIPSQRQHNNMTIMLNSAP